MGWCGTPDPSSRCMGWPQPQAKAAGFDQLGWSHPGRLSHGLAPPLALVFVPHQRLPMVVPGYAFGSGSREVWLYLPFEPGALCIDGGHGRRWGYGIN